MTKRIVPGSAPHAAAGFTLLEAIVALVVFSLGAIALYGWLATNVITLDRIRERQQLEVAMDSALDLVRRSNPMASPTGQRRVGDYTVTWTATPVEPPKDGVDQSGGPSIFLVGLYELDVRATRNGRQVHSFRVRQIGWKQVRTMDDL